jgi:aerotaxis receptor
MKVNLPISGAEQRFPTDANILSTTDLKGAITYVNPDFVAISGYEEQELLGKNHNIIRHPEMPKEAFADLWQHMKDGKPWMGIVKNRIKNGDHYWVDAFVMPIKEEGRVKEYQSVRFSPDAEHVSRADAYYKRLSEGKAVKASLGSRIGLKTKMMLGNLMALLPAVVTAYVESLADMLWLGFALSVLMIIGVTTYLLAPLKQLIAQADEIFNNKLMAKIYCGRDDEFGQIQLAFKMQHSQLKAVLGRISDATHRLSDSATTTSGFAEQTRESVSTQQNEVELISAAVTEMSSTVQEVAGNAAMAAKATEDGQQEIGTGKQVVQETIDSIHSLAAAVQESADAIEKLSHNSAEIGGIIDVIRDIAEQTNLLALNAAIEAARAGEQGRGFAVVADEVRTLAGRTQESTTLIKQMIEGIQSGASQVVEIMENGRAQADSCVSQAEKAGAALISITSAINTISDMNRQIATGSEQQGAVANEIEHKIVNIGELAGFTADGANQSVHATDNLLHTINNLDGLVKQF